MLPRALRCHHLPRLLGLYVTLIMVTPPAAGGSGGPAPQPTATRSKHAEEITRLLESCPCWAGLRREDFKTRSEILKVMSRLDREPLSRIRSGCEFYTRKHQGDLDALATLLVVNRWVFDVPGRVPPDQWFKFGGYSIPSPRFFEYLAPLSRDKDGDLVLTGEGYIYNGPPYRPLAEFDYFHRTFGRRPPRPQLAISGRAGRE